MTLNSHDSMLLASAISCQKTGGNTLLQWMHDATELSTNEYAAIVTAFGDWKTAYDANNLYVTVGGGTQQLTGIDQFPVPTSRS